MMITLVGGMYIVDGQQMVLVSSLVDSIATDLEIDGLTSGALVSTVFVGLAAGGLLAGIVGDMLGRRPTVLIAYVILTVSGTMCAVANCVWVLASFRVLLGVGAGLGVSAMVTLVVESAPTKYCSHLNNVTALFFPLGEMWAAIGLMWFMPFLTGPGWRSLCLWGIYPAILGLPFAHVFLEESPRWLLMRGHYKRLDTLLQRMSWRNGVRIARLNIDAMDAEGSNKQTDSTRQWNFQGFGQLFEPEICRTTWICCYLCLLCNFLFYGQSYALAQVFQRLETDWATPATEMLVTSAFELPGFLLSFALIGMPSIGHREGMSVCAMLVACLHVTLISMDYDLPYVSDPAAYLIKLFTTGLFNMTYVYIPEAYPLRLRQSAVGFCLAFGRLGSILVPLVFEILAHKFDRSSAPFQLFSAWLAVLGAYLCFCLPYDTKGTELMQENSTRGHEKKIEGTLRGSQTPAEERPLLEHSDRQV